jgi:hypothetical protein
LAAINFVCSFEFFSAQQRFLYRRLNTMPVETLLLCPHCIGDGLSPSDGNWIKHTDVVKQVLSGETTFKCGADDVELELLGEDLTLGYVTSISNNQVMQFVLFYLVFVFVYLLIFVFWCLYLYLCFNDMKGFRLFASI